MKKLTNSLVLFNQYIEEHKIDLVLLHKERGNSCAFEVKEHLTELKKAIYLVSNTGVTEYLYIDHNQLVERFRV